jgi:hypothetical protein
MPYRPGNEVMCRHTPARLPEGSVCGAGLLLADDFDECAIQYTTK